MRAAAMLEKGDLDGYAVWKRGCARARRDITRTGDDRPAEAA